MASSHFAHQSHKQEHLEHLFSSLYPHDSQTHLNRLHQIMADASAARPPELKEADQSDLSWYMSNRLVGDDALHRPVCR